MRDAAPDRSRDGEDRTLIVHDRATLDAADFSLQHTLAQLAEQAVEAGAVGTTAESVFASLWDTQNSSTDGVTSGAHCTDNGGTINGYPVSCRPIEGALAKHPAQEMAKYWPIALVNRIDLAHEGWRNCGEHRIIYGRNDVPDPSSQKRSFIIFEAVLPNPQPGCRSACQPVADLWRDFSDPALTTSERAAARQSFYYDGLSDVGFTPVVHLDHYTEGDSRRASELLQRLINDTLRAEPPRRTVTGSFRVH